MTDPFTTIDGLSDKRRLPRLGKIRLGETKISKKTNNPFPKATDYFVWERYPDKKDSKGNIIPGKLTPMGEACKKACGDKPRELDVFLPSDDIHKMFPQAYKAYKKSRGKWCWGDGIDGERMDDNGVYQPIVCNGWGDKDAGKEPCPEFAASPARCKRTANLLIGLPLVAAHGVFQIDTSSYHSIIDLNSGIEGIIEKAKEYDRPVESMPCVLRITTRQVQPGGNRKNVFTLSITLANYDRMKVLAAKFDEVKRVLTGSEPLALPPTEQSKYEEKDLISSDVWEGDEPEDAEIVDPATDILDPLKFPPEGIPNDLIKAWDNIIMMAHKKAVDSWDKLAKLESERSGESMQSLKFEDMGKDRLKDIWRMLDGREG